MPYLTARVGLEVDGDLGSDGGGLRQETRVPEGRSIGGGGGGGEEEDGAGGC